MKEAKNVLKILKDARGAVLAENVVTLHRLSNQTIHTASITHDPDNIAVAVIIYSIGKIIERGKNGDAKKCGEICKKVPRHIDNLIAAITNNNESATQKELSSLRKQLEGSGEFKKYIQDVFRKASINKASKIHEHGISMETTASLLGITMFELASYSGQRLSAIHEKTSKTIDVKSRIKLAVEMFNG